MADTLNQKVVVWASGQIGKSIGAGECWDLANSALKQAGAGSSADFGPSGDDADYVWGTAIPDLKDVIPGDILQYRDYVMTTTTKVDVTFSDQGGWDDTTSAKITHPHHTSIVSINSGNGNLTVLEQNEFGNHEKVKSTAMRWKDAPTSNTTENKMMDRKGKKEMAKVVTTVDITVTGTINAYRPKVK